MKIHMGASFPSKNKHYLDGIFKDVSPVVSVMLPAICGKYMYTLKTKVFNQHFE